MALFKLNGKMYDAKLSYKAIGLIEKHFDMPLADVLSDKTRAARLDTLNVILWAALQREDDFKGKTIDDIVDILDAAFENGDMTVTSFVEAVTKMMEESTFFQQAAEEGQKTAGKRKK